MGREDELNNQALSESVASRKAPLVATKVDLLVFEHGCRLATPCSSCGVDCMRFVCASSPLCLQRDRSKVLLAELNERHLRSR